MVEKKKEWIEMSREIAFQKYSRKIEKVIFELPDGKESDFYIKKEGPAVAVLALDVEKNVILAKQFRPGPQKVFYELPGGYLDANEKPEFSAARELKEETGYEGNIQFVGTCSDDAYSTMLRYCFVATDCKETSEQKLDEGEYVEIVTKTIEEFREILRSGEMTDVEVGYLGLDFLKLL
ncbi:MAG: NUDIX hydrolase [Minisyncoccota bacterium]